MSVTGMAPPSLPPAWNVPEVDFIHPIFMFKGGNDVIRTFYQRRWINTVPYDYGQRWPDIQHLPHRSSLCAVKSQI